MKILCLTSGYPVPGSPVGPFMENFYRRVVEQGHEVRVLIYSAQGRFSRNVRNGIEVIEYPYSLFLPPRLHIGTALLNSMKISFLAKVEFPFYIVASFYYLIKFSKDCDLIHAQSFLPNGFVAVLGKKIHRKPVLVSARGKEFHLPKNFLFRWALNFVNNGCSQAVSVSQYLKDKGLEYGLDGSKIQVIPNGIKAEDYSLPRKSKTSSEIVLCYACRLVPEKRTEDVIQAFSRLMQAPPAPNIVLWIVGGGEEFGRLVKLAKDLKVDRKVKFWGYVQPREMPALYSEVDIFVNPTEEEGMANNNIEAMASGAVVVCSKGVGNDEVVMDGVNGFCFPIGDVERIADILRDLIQNPQKRKEMARAAQDHIRKNFHSNLQVSRYLEVYRKLGR